MTMISDSHEFTASGDSDELTASVERHELPASDDSRLALEGRAGRLLVRTATVGGAVLATTAIFLVARAAGADFTITDPGTAKASHTFVALEIATVTAIFGVLGWITLAALERWTRRAHRIWTTLATAVVLLSLVPIGIERATTQTRIGLGLIHLAVGIALLPMLAVRRGPGGR